MRSVECDNTGCTLEPSNRSFDTINSMDVQVGGGGGLIPLEYNYMSQLGQKAGSSGSKKRKAYKPKKQIQKGFGRRLKGKQKKRRTKRTFQVGGKRKRRPIKKCSVAYNTSNRRVVKSSRNLQSKYKRPKN